MTVSGHVHLDDIPGRKVDMGPLCGTWSDVGRAAGSVATGLKRMRIEPGRRSTPAHVHDAEEEIFYVLSGSGLSWQDGTTCAVGAGDCIVHVAGGKAHTLIAGDDGMDVLAFGTRHPASTARLPRAGVAWLGSTWVEIGREPHPWSQELNAGELEVPEPGDRPANVVSVDSVEEIEVAHGDTDRRQRALGLAGGSRLTGLNHVLVKYNLLNCPPHVHACEEEIFVILEGDGTMLLFDCDVRPQVPVALENIQEGDVIVRTAGSGVAHAFQAGVLGMTMLAYGLRRSDETVFYPRSGKIRMRGLGVTGRLQPCDYWDGEPPVT